MIKVNNPNLIGFSTECKVIFSSRYPMPLINDNCIYKAEFNRLHPEGIPYEDAEFLIISISEREKIMMSFLLSKVYQKKDNENWVLRENSFFLRRSLLLIDKEYLILRGLLNLGLTPEEEHHDRVSERFEFTVIFKKSPLLVEVINKVFNLRLE